MTYSLYCLGRLGLTVCVISIAYISGHCASAAEITSTYARTGHKLRLHGKLDGTEISQIENYFKALGIQPYELTTRKIWQSPVPENLHNPGNLDSDSKLQEYGPFTIHLNSKGGNPDVGVDLAEFFYLHGVTTIVDGGSECKSACAIAFMGGTQFFRDHQGYPSINRKPKRVLHIKGKLWFHAPQLNLNQRLVTLPEEELSDVIISSYEAATDTIARLIQLSERIAFKRGLIAHLLRKSTDRTLSSLEYYKWYKIQTVGQATAWGIHLTGYPVQVFAGGSSFLQYCVNQKKWIDEVPYEDLTVLSEVDRIITGPYAGFARRDGNDLSVAQLAESFEVLQISNIKIYKATFRDGSVCVNRVYANEGAVSHMWGGVLTGLIASQYTNLTTIKSAGIDQEPSVRFDEFHGTINLGSETWKFFEPSIQLELIAMN